MILCGGNVWEYFDGEKEGVIDYMYLAISAGINISISVTYILFLTEMQKRQTPENGFAFLKNDITNVFYP